MAKYVCMYVCTVYILIDVVGYDKRFIISMYAYVCMHVCAYTRVFIYVRMYVCMHLIFVYVYCVGT